MLLEPDIVFFNGVILLSLTKRHDRVHPFTYMQPTHISNACLCSCVLGGEALCFN